MSQAEYARRWAQAHPEKIAEASRQWKAAHPQKAAEITGRWKKANPERVAEHALRYREKNRVAAVALLGGKCAHCGATERLHFHHIDPTTKIACVSELIRANDLDEVLTEAAKCELLCGPCHRSHHKPQRREKP
jgi:formate-dependent nitrite reductase cytochrome c552 subunit